MKTLRSNSGFGIIEILIAFGLVGILTAVMTTLFSNIQKQQRQTNMVTSINTLRETILKTITDGRAWENTISDGVNRAASTDCLFSRTPCTHTVVGADPVPPTNAFFDAAPFQNIPRLMDAGNVPTAIIRALPNTGFTLNGTACDTYIAPPADGNDACPFRWTVRMQFICPGAAVNCVDPGVRVFAMLNYNPNPNSGLAVNINPSKYIIIMTRGARGENRSEQMVYRHQGVGAGTGGGACTPGAWRNIPLGVEFVDQGNNGTLAAGVVTFVPGTYNCSATASCFSCRSLMMAINIGGVRRTSPGSVGPDGTMLNVSITIPDIRLNAPTPIFLEHFCVSNPVCSAPGCPVTYGMGMAVADYAIPTQFSTLTCTRVF